MSGLGILFLVLSIVATLITIGVTWLVIMANAMSSNPSASFQGGGILIFFYIATVASWITFIAV